MRNWTPAVPYKTACIELSRPLALVKIVVASLRKRHERKSFSRFVDNIEKNESDSKMEMSQ